MEINKKKVFVIGLDCLTPQLVFDEWYADLPNLRNLIESGIYAEIKSTIPPITIPAWTSMLSSKNSGTLGFYGFRNRSDYTYSRMNFATSLMVKEDMVWDILSKQGKKVILVGVPQTYPVKPINGYMISCFLTPDTNSQYTYPVSLKKEIEDLVGEYILDVKEFRTENKEYLIKQIYQMTETRFKVIRHLLKTKEWDFFMFVEMGPDRIHHGLWKFCDKSHAKYQAGNPFEFAIKDYYKYLDTEIGQILSMLDTNTDILVVSDHGAKAMYGGVCLNEWLIQNSYLTIKQKPPGIVPLEKVEIDWSKTIAWGSGGYYGRLFLNVKGREPQGVIQPSDYESVRDELMLRLLQIRGENNQNINTRIFKPQEVYKECKGVPPDLIIYFGNLDWRAVGSIGHNRVLTFENDTGPDDANHAENGVFILKNGRIKGKREGLNILDIAPTILNLMDLPVPEDMEGRVIN